MDIYCKEIDVRNDVHYLNLYIKEIVRELDNKGAITKEDRHRIKAKQQSLIKALSEVEGEILELKTIQTCLKDVVSIDK